MILYWRIRTGSNWWF